MIKYSPELDGVYRALADPTRRRMIELLAAGPVSVSELAGPFAMTLPAALQHVRVLESSGIIRTEKHGRVRHCHLNHGRIAEAESWLARQRSAWNQRFDRLDRHLATLQHERDDPREDSP